MRFSRFRSSVIGHEPQKRKGIADKCRITKSTKKPQQTKRSSLVKSESGTSLASYTQVCQDSPKVKQEKGQPSYLAQFSPASNPSPYLTAEGRDDFNTRFLTPCSDDMSHGLVNPTSLEDLRQRNGFGPSADFSPDMMQTANHDAIINQSPLNMNTFEAEYDMSNYGMGANDDQSVDALELNTNQPLAGCGQDWTMFSDHIY